MGNRWRIELLGGLRAARGARAVSRFRTQKTAALLGYLALFSHRAHARDALIFLFWPDASPERGRHSLSQALSSLRTALEPPGVAPGSVLLADRHTIRLNPESICTDVAEFEAALAAARASKGEDRRRHLLGAVETYRGELLPGLYEAWALPERERLAAAYLEAVEELIAGYEAEENPAEAMALARRAVRADPLREEAHHALIRLLFAAGQADEARRQQRELERLLRHEGGDPSPFEARPSSEPGSHVSPDGRAPAGEPRAGNLPHPLTRFFGRDTEIEALTRLLEEEETRLVTLTGAGGSGKSRLAVEAAGRLDATWRRRVWIVALADLGEASRIPEAIRDALGLPRSSHAEPVEQIAAAVAERPTLLVLDNFEHLVAEGAPLLRGLLERAPSLTCLVTSRRRLGIAGERELTVGPLATPTAVRLFVDRAEAANPHFRRDAATLETVARLCERLEGIPLSIELAAARTTVLAPARMLARLSQRLDLLVSHRHDGPERHRSLRAALEWSYRLLSPELQRFFALLSVFRGGWSEEAAAAVCDNPLALDLLEQLRDATLVLAEESAGEVRFRMLETMREYAAEQLSPQERTEVERRHAGYFLELLERRFTDLHGPDQRQWLERLEPDLENLRACGDGCVARGEPEAALRFGACVWWLFHLWSRHREGQARLDAILALAEGAPPSPTRTRVIHGAGIMAYYNGDLDRARRRFDEALPLRRAGDDPHRLAWLLWDIGVLERDRGEFAVARPYLEEALEIFRTVKEAAPCYSRESWPEEAREMLLRGGDPLGIATTLLALGIIRLSEGDLEAAEAQIQEVLRISRAFGDPWGISGALHNLGCIARERCDLERAERLLVESHAIYVDLGYAQGISWLRGSLGSLACFRGDREQAEICFRESLAIMEAQENPLGCIGPRNALGRLLCHQGKMAEGRALIEESRRALRKQPARPVEADIQLSLGEAELLAGRPAAAARHFAAALALRRAMGARLWTLADFEGMARAARRLGDPARAARLAGATAALREAMGTPVPPSLRGSQERLHADLRAALGEGAEGTLPRALTAEAFTPSAGEPGGFAAEWAAGAALSWEEAVAEALAGAAPDDVPGERLKVSELTDPRWERVRPLIPAPAVNGRPRTDDRRVLEGILYLLRTGCPWRDLPARYGSPATCWRRYRQWQADGAWEKIRAALDDPA